MLHRPVITLMATVLLVAACASESGPKTVEDRADTDGGEHEEAPVTVAPDREAEGEATSGATFDDSELEAPSAAEEMGDPGAAEAPTSTIDVLDGAGRAEEPPTSKTSPAEQPEVGEDQSIPDAEQPEEPDELQEPDQSGEVAEPQEPSEPEEFEQTQEPEQIEQAEQPEEPEPEPVEPTPTAEVIVSGSPAPEWPFRGLVETDFVSDSDVYVIRYLRSRDRTVTETMVAGLIRNDYLDGRIGSVSEAGVTVSATRGSERVEIVVPWGETASVVPRGQYPDGDASWQDIRLSVTSLTHGYIIGGTPFDVSVHSNGVRVQAGDSAANYGYYYSGDGDPPQNPELYGGSLDSWTDVYFLGTDGEFVGFATRPYEPAGARASAYLLSMRTGEVLACGIAGDGLVLVQPPDEGLLVEETTLPNNRQLHSDEQCGEQSASLTELWGSLRPSGAPYPPRQPGPEPAPLPLATAPPWPFRGAVLALQRYSPSSFSYETVLQYYSSEDGSVTEFVFGPMRTLSRDLAVDANEHAVEVSRYGWAVRVPWGEAAEPLEVDPDRPRAARATAYPTRLEFGPSHAKLEIESVYAHALVTRFSAHNKQSWYVWSAPDESRIDTEVEIISRPPVFPFWLRGTDGRIAAISQRGSGEDCAYMCSPVLTVLISLETGQVLSCGWESDGVHALVFVAPTGSNMTRNVTLPPSGWLDPRQCYTHRTDAFGNCSWLAYSPDEPTCSRHFKLTPLSDGIADVLLVPARIQADMDRRRLLIQPVLSG